MVLRRRGARREGRVLLSSERERRKDSLLETKAVVLFLFVFLFFKEILPLIAGREYETVQLSRGLHSALPWTKQSTLNSSLNVY